MKNQKHTKESWSYDEDEQEIHCDVLADRGGDPLHICEMMGSKERKDTNGKRIVECVNACAGIESPLDLRQQRDELRGALEAVAAWQDIDHICEDKSYCEADRSACVACIVEIALTKTKESV